MTNQLQTLARLLEYPVSNAAESCDSHSSPEPSASEKLPVTGAAGFGLLRESQLFTGFRQTFTQLSQDEREELYTSTFDVTPACVPYVSIHLFGEENFKRGEFMAALSARYAAAGFDARGELPDHIAVLLRFLAQTDEAERRELVQFCLLGPLGKMIGALSTENPYRALLEAVREVLTTAYPGLQAALSPLEQMQTHGAACATDASGCGGCGSVQTLELSTTP